MHIYIIDQGVNLSKLAKKNQRPLNEPSNPSIFCQILSFEIFTHSESMGSTTYVVRFLYSNS